MEMVEEYDEEVYISHYPKLSGFHCSCLATRFQCLEATQNKALQIMTGQVKGE